MTTMRTTVITAAALVAAFVVSPHPARAQMEGPERKCVKTLYKDGNKLAATYAKELAACLAGAQDGTVADLAACVAAAPGADVAALVTKGDADAMKGCGYSPAPFAIPAAFDDMVGEAATVHTRGLVTDLLGASPAPAGDDAGKRCQKTALSQVQKLAAAYAKAFTKCVGGKLKDGATDGDALAACLAPDVTKAEGKLVESITKDCSAVSPAVVLPGDCSSETGATVGDCLKERVRCRACRRAATTAAIDSDCDLVDDGVDNDSCSFPVTVSGNALNFGDHARIDGAVVWVLEHPEMTTTTNADGYFGFNAIQEGEEVTLVLEHPDFHPIQNGTIRPGPSGASRVTFQAVTWGIYDALAFVVGITPDEVNKCQMVTTVTRVGKSIYDTGAHGDSNATVTIDPLLTQDHGPIYFNSSVLPAPALSRTSDDGGTLYVQVPPGDYVWTAHKGDILYTRIKSKCRAGLLVNASPPWGLQRH
jgi:hypothetical protein